VKKIFEKWPIGQATAIELTLVENYLSRYNLKGAANHACTRPPIRRKFQDYFRVVIVFRGQASFVAPWSAGDAYVGPLLLLIRESR